MRNKRDRRYSGDADARRLNYRPFVQTGEARGNSPAGRNLSVASRRHFRCLTMRRSSRSSRDGLVDVPSLDSPEPLGSAVDRAPLSSRRRAFHYPERAITRINDRRLVIRADEIPAITSRPSRCRAPRPIADIGITSVGRLESTPIV